MLPVIDDAAAVRKLGSLSAAAVFNNCACRRHVACSVQPRDKATDTFIAQEFLSSKRTSGLVISALQRSSAANQLVQNRMLLDIVVFITIAVGWPTAHVLWSHALLQEKMHRL